MTRGFKANTKKLLLCSAGGILLTAAAFGDAYAAAAPAAPESGAELETVVVTASRVERQGFTAPTPTTVLGQQELQLRAPSNVVDLVNQVPSFRATQTSISRPAFQGSGPVSVDLRGLGSRRTLTLIDNSRFVPAAANGVVDLNEIPTNMIERAEVVTGGASAAWGSDAVSGVVNFITKKRFEGLDGDLSWGESQYGDNQQWHGTMTAGGKFGNDRGHFVFGGEYFHQTKVSDAYARPWGRQEYGTVTYATVPAGQPAQVFVAHGSTNSGIKTFGGVIIGAAAQPLENALFGNTNQGVQFAPGGGVIPYNFGQIITPATTASGVPRAMVGGGVPGETGGRLLGLSPQENRYVTMANFDYEITPHITATAQLNFARSEVFFLTASRRDFNTPTPVPAASSSNSLITDYISIRRDNAYLPANVGAAMDQTNISQFYLSRVGFDIGMANGHSSNEVHRAVFGLNGDFGIKGLGDNWKWNISYETGRNEYYQPWSNEAIESRWQKAYDAVRGPNGQPICRVNLPGSPNPDSACVPFNVFGYQSATNLADVKNYIMGTLIQDTVYKQQFGEANLSGEPFSTWAGPVSIALGASWREDKVKQTSDAVSQVTDFDNQNPKPYAGQYTAKEAYGETVIPLLKDQPFFKSVEFNGAIRRTNYSTSGSVTTWKTGATWQVNDGLRFRGNISRDIRAPNLLELYGIATAVSALNPNPFTRVATGSFQQVTGGNPDLVPEIAKTYTAGVVLEPHFLPRFRFSIDYYHINIQGAIAAYTVQQTANFCAQEVQLGGPGFFCSQINSNGQYNNNNVVNGVSTVPFNLQKQTVEGIDYEAQYSFPLAGGNMDLRAFATYLGDLSLYPPATANLGKTQYAGSVFSIFNGLGGSPTWTGTINTTYSYKRATVSLQTRLLSKAKIDPTKIGPDSSGYTAALSNPALVNTTININTVPARAYFNLAANYDIIRNDGQKLTVYGIINNLLNSQPPLTVGSSTGLYDTLGRFFKIGARFSY